MMQPLSDGRRLLLCSGLVLSHSCPSVWPLMHMAFSPSADSSLTWRASPCACAPRSAVSGGAIYVSDKPGEHDFGLLKQVGGVSWG